MIMTYTICHLREIYLLDKKLAPRLRERLPIICLQLSHSQSIRFVALSFYYRQPIMITMMLIVTIIMIILIIIS